MAYRLWRGAKAIARALRLARLQRLALGFAGGKGKGGKGPYGGGKGAKGGGKSFAVLAAAQAAADLHRAHLDLLRLRWILLTWGYNKGKGKGK